VTSRHTISAVVPIYNERAAVAGAVAQIDAFLAAHCADYEIILVESGSTDGTREACDRLAETVPSVCVYHEGRRNGFGSALRAGIGLARMDWVWPLVVDMPFALTALEAALPHMNSFDCVLSYRSVDPRGVFRRIQSAVFNRLGRALLGVHVRHINSAFKVIRTSLLRSMSLRSNGWVVDAEIIMNLEDRGVRWTEIPVALVPRQTGQSSVGLGASLRTAADLFELGFKRQRERSRATSSVGTPK